jgi:hypothetical protein
MLCPPFLYDSVEGHIKQVWLYLDTYIRDFSPEYYENK